MAAPQPSTPTGQQTVMAPGGMQAQSGPSLLRGVSGPLAGMAYPLVGMMEIGREGTGITLAADVQASRRHAMITPTQAGMQLQDLGSTNGTYVNGVKVTTALLRMGDIIKIGSSEFRVE